MSDTGYDYGVDADDALRFLDIDDTRHMHEGPDGKPRPLFTPEEKERLFGPALYPPMSFQPRNRRDRKRR